ncbi:MAG: hypothetical protein PCFJNLEI_04214 [Verrucomicrobiae bacterium]|nr:hypothetical protein [Verrucomicrobiae bacterium]
MKHTFLRHATRVHRNPDVAMQMSLRGAPEELAEIEEVLPVEFGRLIWAIRSREKKQDFSGGLRDGDLVTGTLQRNEPT